MQVNWTTSWGGGAELEPDVLLPSQFFARPGSGASPRPEWQLMLAVLEEAVAIFQKNVMAGDHRDRRLFAEAAEWFASDDTGWAFSFVNTCHVLGLDPDGLRSGLRRWCVRQHWASETRIMMRSPSRRLHGSRRAIAG
ncbi:MAG: hypothetical protein U0807_09970 [Candidatus Binatia bacterium]